VYRPVERVVTEDEEGENRLTGDGAIQKTMTADRLQDVELLPGDFTGENVVVESSTADVGDVVAGFSTAAATRDVQAFRFSPLYPAASTQPFPNTTEDVLIHILRLPYTAFLLAVDAESWRNPIPAHATNMDLEIH
jgi:hypothetical protein